MFFKRVKIPHEEYKNLTLPYLHRYKRFTDGRVFAFNEPAIADNRFHCILMELI